MTATAPYDPAPRRALARHVLVGVPWGACWTTVVAGGLAAGIALFPLGLPVAGATLLLVPLGAEIERDRAGRLLGRRPTRAEPYPDGTRLDRLRAHLQSKTTWREVAHLVTFGPIAAAELVVVAAWALATVAAVSGGWWLPDGSISIGPVPLARPLVVSLLAVNGAAALLAGPALGRALAGAHRRCVGRLLGAPDADLRTRVEEAERRQRLLQQAAQGERERIERDLHDGLQPVLVSAAVTIAGARKRLDADPARAAHDLDEAQTMLQTAMDDVRALVQGLAPRSLRESGLDAALGELAGSAPVPVELAVDLLRPVDDEPASAAYFVASEAVTNAVRHSGAQRITICVIGRDDRLDVVVTDDGIGGARPRAGRGLDGLDARLRAIGGELHLHSPTGTGTIVSAAVPIGATR